MKYAEQRRASAHQRLGSGTERAATAASIEGSITIGPMQEYVLSELDSGERLITERVASVRSVSLGFWIGAGSRDEPDAKAGVSHFIEHLLFKGTRSYDAQQIAEIFDEMGGELNAATSREHTVVYARVPDRHLEDALDVMADMVFSPTLRRPRLRARGRARGDRDGRGRAAGSRPRPALGGRVLASTRSAGP